MIGVILAAILSADGADSAPVFEWTRAAADGGDPFAIPKQALGALDKEEIRKVIHSHRVEVRECFEKHHALLRHLPKTTVKFLIGTDGRVAAIRSTGDGSNLPLTRCVGEAVASWRFPAPRGGPVLITYPFLIKMVAG